MQGQVNDMTEISVARAHDLLGTEGEAYRYLRDAATLYQVSTTERMTTTVYFMIAPDAPLHP